MLNKVTALVVILLLCGFGVSQAQNLLKRSPVITGDEVRDLSNNPKVITSGTVSFDAISSGGLAWDVHNITDRKTGYDFMSNGVPQQIWVDPNAPDFLHAVFTNSQTDDGTWADRTSLYFGSTDKGLTWFELGEVPVNNGTDGRSGFPAIYGTSTGAAVIANHNNSNGTTTHSKVFIDASPFEYNFTEYDPGADPLAGSPIWPRIILNPDDSGIMASSINLAGSGWYLNTWSGGVFSGWDPQVGDQAESYSLAMSDGGKIGLAYEGEPLDGEYDIFYIESTDGGSTWSDSIKIFDADVITNPDSLRGTWRGLSMSFYMEEPCVVWEIGSVATGEGYFPGSPGEIAFWSPNINGGVYKTIADSNSVPFFTNGLGNSDTHFSICKPTIGRSQMHNYLFVAFPATTGEYWPGTMALDSTAFFGVWFMHSTDGGDTWTGPDKITPDTPLRDWRYPSLAPVSPVHSLDDDVITVHMVAQGDSLPGSVTNASPPQPIGVTAQYYHYSTEIMIVSADEDPVMVNDFNLEQNYPNPFNPGTKINYSIAERSNVTIKVYDVLGNEIATLINTTQEAGAYNVNFDASQLSSGLYIYKLNAGNFTSSKKMMLLK